jgi:hypothetical protein
MILPETGFGSLQMPSELRWIVEGRVLYSRYYGVVTMDTMRNGADSFVNFLDNADVPKVHVIYDNTQQTKGPTNIMQIRQVSKPVFEHPKIGWNVVITPHPLNKFLTSMLMQAYKVQWRAVNSYQEAVEFLQGLEHDLPPLPQEPPLHYPTVVQIQA